MAGKNQKRWSIPDKIGGVTIEGKYKVVRTERAELGRFAIRLDTVRKAGKDYPYSYMEGQDSVAVLGRKDDRFVFIRQYRHSVMEHTLEIPGGAVEHGEDALETAMREMREETGYELRNMKPMGCFYPSVGSSDEKCYLFYGECGEKRNQLLEPLEELFVELLTYEQVEQAIIRNELQHSMALVIWLKYRLIREAAGDVNRKNKV